jgi:hypothetical protein
VQKGHRVGRCERRSGPHEEGEYGSADSAAHIHPQEFRQQILRPYRNLFGVRDFILSSQGVVVGATASGPARCYTPAVWTFFSAPFGTVSRETRASCSSSGRAGIGLPFVSCSAIQFGWECRLMVRGELVQAQVCRSQDEVLSTGEQWKGALIEKGWSAGAAIEGAAPT